MKGFNALNILLADDDMDDRFFFEKAVNDLTIPILLTKVSDGERLFKYLDNHRKSLPDVIFLDLNMPRINGNECLLRLKENKKYLDIPVVIYSTSLRDEVANILYESGAHYYLQKCDFPDLKQCIFLTLSLLLDNPERPDREHFILTSHSYLS